MAEVSGRKRELIQQARREVRDGWIHVVIAGDAWERGYQYGAVIAEDYAEARRTFSAMTFETLGNTLDFFSEHAERMHKHHLGDELLEELEGTAEGMTDAGVPTTVRDLIGWNAWMEMTEYWWPTVADQFTNTTPPGPRGSHCSAFIATGSATSDGKIVLGHESFDDFWAGQHFNVILDLTPSDGHRIVMQTIPGCFGSMTDFLVTSAGLAVTETTIACFKGYDEEKVPEYVRGRRASQYADDIDQWIALMNEGNNGGYANTWLIADTNTGEIARFEEGLMYQNLTRTFDGVYFGANVAFDPRIRNHETYDSGYNDPRQHTGARRLRWMQLLEVHTGSIDVKVGMEMLADTFDPYLGYTNPSSRTICAHFDADPMHYASDPHAVWNIPFVPAGSVDSKVAHHDDIRSMTFWARFGRANGVEFNADDFLRQHPLWNWQAEVLKSRPSQPWIRV